MADIEKLITQLDEALKDERTAENLRRVSRILGGDQVQQVDVKVSIDDLIKRLAGLETDVGILMATDASKSRSIGDLRGLVNGLTEDLADLRHEVASAVSINGEELTRIENRLNDLLKLIQQGAERVTVWRDMTKNLAVKVEQLEDAAGWADGKNMENATAPVDTSWHTYDVNPDHIVGDHPKGAVRLMTLVRGGDFITGPERADNLNWGECGGGTIVAWRYAKAGE